MSERFCIGRVSIEKYETEDEYWEDISLLDGCYTWSDLSREGEISSDEKDGERSFIKSDIIRARSERMELLYHPPLEWIADAGEDEEEMSGKLRKIHYFLDFISDLRYQIIMRNDALIHIHIPGKITVMILYWLSARIVNIWRKVVIQ